MDLEFLAGLTDQPSQERGGHIIPNNTIVKYLILARNINVSGKKLVEHYNLIESKEAELIGGKSIPTPFDIKHCGVQYEVIITHYLDPITKEFVPTIVDGQFPDSIITSRIDQLPFPLAHKVINDSITLYPNIYMRYFKGGNAGANNIELTFIPAFPKPSKNEKYNKRNIDKLTKDKRTYASLSDELAELVIDNTLGMQYMLYKINEANKPVYYKPEIGMYGFARFYSAKGSYFNLDAYGYNKNTKEEEIFNLGYQCVSPTEDSIKLASELLDQVNQRREEYLKSKENETNDEVKELETAMAEGEGDLF